MYVSVCTVQYTGTLNFRNVFHNTINGSIFSHPLECCHLAFFIINQLFLRSWTIQHKNIFTIRTSSFRNQLVQINNQTDKLSSFVKLVQITNKNGAIKNIRRIFCIISFPSAQRLTQFFPQLVRCRYPLAPRRALSRTDSRRRAARRPRPAPCRELSTNKVLRGSYLSVLNSYICSQIQLNSSRRRLVWKLQSKEFLSSTCTIYLAGSGKKKKVKRIIAYKIAFE